MTGVMMLKAPKPQRQPGPLRKASLMGPDSQVVTGTG